MISEPSAIATDEKVPDKEVVLFDRLAANLRGSEFYNKWYQINFSFYYIFNVYSLSRLPPSFP